MNKCKCKACKMTKIGLDYICNRCHKPEFDIDDSIQEANENYFFDECEAEWRRENDEEARIENEGKEAMEDKELEEYFDQKYERGGDIYE